MDVFFAVDIILTFFTGYITDQEEIIFGFWPIVKNYLKTWFFLDVLSVLPFGMFLEEGEYAILIRAARFPPKISKIVRISRVLRTTKSLRKTNTFWSLVFDFFLRNPGINTILVNLSAIFVVCHLSACLWHYIGVKADSMDNWIDNNSL